MIDPRHPNFASTPVSHDRPRFGYAPERSRGARAPAATIITPFYNVGPVFHETARSILGQSLQNFEWIIINDASTAPESLEVLETYRAMARRDERIRVIDHAQNLGLCGSRNTGFREARTGYVFQIDGDDLIEPTTVEKCLLTLVCNPEFAFAHGLSVGFQGQEYLWDKGFHSGQEFLRENQITATGMIRTRVHASMGGFDESIRGGLEDWEFWLRAADQGHWGCTIDEYLDWYRRRPRQHDDWANLRTKDAQERFRAAMADRFPRAFGGAFPRPARRWHMPYDDVPAALGVENTLSKAKPRLLVLQPWFRMGGADKYALDLIRQLGGRGWEITLVATLGGHPWLGDFARVTPDVFMLGNYAQLPNYPRLMRYLIESRRPDVVLITNSETGYLMLPYLRSHCPGPAYVDYNHMEEEHWKNGGHPRSSVGWRAQLDLTITSSNHLKQWMLARGGLNESGGGGNEEHGRGGEPDRIEVCTTNCDASHWKPDAAARRRVREALGLSADETVLLYAVRLTDQKQPMVFGASMRQLAELLGENQTFTALVAGDGEDRGRLELFLHENNLRGRVRMLGAVAQKDMPALFAASDIFFLPSKWEGIALSMFEAMATGLAVVGADVGGQRELVTPETGVLIDRAGGTISIDDEARQYAAILARLIRDPAERARMGRAARRRIIEHYQLSAMGDRMIELFALAQRNALERPRERIGRAIAHELAVQGVESVRLHELSEELWQYRDRVMAMNGIARSPESIIEAKRALAQIERADSWRAIGRLKQTLPYRLIARVRFGAGWERWQTEGDECQRLSRIQQSRTYRLIQALKASAPGRLITRLRHGE